MSKTPTPETKEPKPTKYLSMDSGQFMLALAAAAGRTLRHISHSAEINKFSKEDTDTAVSAGATIIEAYILDLMAVLHDMASPTGLGQGEVKAA